MIEQSEAEPTQLEIVFEVWARANQRTADFLHQSKNAFTASQAMLAAGDVEEYRLLFAEAQRLLADAEASGVWTNDLAVYHQTLTEIDQL